MSASERSVESILGSLIADDELLIKPVSGWPGVDLRELWRYRELLFFFVWRDFKVRYKQTFVGASWAIVQPLISMVVISFVFTTVTTIDTGDIPYPIFTYTGLLPWTFFAAGIARASGSMIGSAGLITKVYFPRLFLPVSSVVGGLIDFVLSFIVLFGLMVYYDIYPSFNVLWLLPLLMLLVLATALGVGLWLAAINVYYRDIRYIVPFFTQFWLYLTPVIYPADKLSSSWQLIYGLNPMVGVVEGFRWVLLDRGEPPGPTIILSAVISVVLVMTGALYFRRLEASFADYI